MNCTVCQSSIPDGSVLCPVCQSSLRQVPQLRSTPPQIGQTQKQQQRCPYCQTSIPATPTITACPTCQRSLVIAATAPSIQPPQPLPPQPLPPQPLPPQFPPLAPPQPPAPILRGAILEGTVLGEPLQLPNEPRDRDWLQMVMVILFLLLGLALIIPISIRLASFALIFVVLGILLNMTPIASIGGGCLQTALSLPFRLLGSIWRPFVEAFNPSINPNNMRQVREYTLDNQSVQQTFSIKGNLAPRTLRTGDYVRVQTTQRYGRPYFTRGNLRDNAGNWTRLHVSEAPVGLYWMIAFVISIVGLYLLGTAA